MRPQSYLIAKVNYILQNNQFPNRFNQNGVCGGLSALFAEYALSGKINEFEALINKVAALEEQHQIGTDAEIDDFLRKIMSYFSPNRHLSTNIQSGYYDELFTINGKKPRNEFNLGTLANQAAWEELLIRVANENRVFSIEARKHVVNIYFKNNEFIFYDSNSPEFKRFSIENMGELINCIKENLFIAADETEFELSLRAFADANKEAAIYPSADYIYDMVKVNWQSDAEKLKTVFIRAYRAKDITTLEKIMLAPDFQIDVILPEYPTDSFLDVIVEKMPCGKAQYELCKTGILRAFTLGQPDRIEALFQIIQTNYGSKDQLNDFYQFLARDLTADDIQFAPIADYGQTIHLLQKRPYQAPLCLFFQNLTYIDQGLPISISDEYDFLNQVKLAIKTHQTRYLETLMQLKLYESCNPLTLENLKHIESLDLTICGQAGVRFPPDGLPLIIERHDKALLNAYWQNILHFAGKEADQLKWSDKFDSLSYLDILIFQRENETVKAVFEDITWSEMDEATIQSWVISAVKAGNLEIVQHLKPFLADLSDYAESEIHDRPFWPDVYNQLQEDAATYLKEMNAPQCHCLSEIGYPLFFKHGFLADQPTELDDKSWGSLIKLYQLLGDPKIWLNGFDQAEDDAHKKHAIWFTLAYADDKVLAELQSDDYRTKIITVLADSIYFKTVMDKINQFEPAFIRAILTEYLGKADANAGELLQRLVQQNQSQILAVLIEKEAFVDWINPLEENMFSLVARTFNHTNQASIQLLLQRFHTHFLAETNLSKLLKRLIDEQCWLVVADLLDDETIRAHLKTEQLTTLINHAWQTPENKPLMSKLLEHFSDQTFDRRTPLDLINLYVNDLSWLFTDHATHLPTPGQLINDMANEGGEISTLNALLQVAESTIPDDEAYEFVRGFFGDKPFQSFVEDIVDHHARKIFSIYARHNVDDEFDKICQPVRSPRSKKDLRRTNTYATLVANTFLKSRPMPLTLGEEHWQQIFTRLIDTSNHDLLVYLASQEIDLNELCAKALEAEQNYPAAILIAEFLGSNLSEDNQVFILDRKDEFKIIYLEQKRHQLKSQDIRHDLFALIHTEGSENCLAALFDESDTMSITDAIFDNQRMLLAQNNSLAGKAFQVSVYFTEAERNALTVKQQLDNLVNAIASKEQPLTVALRDPAIHVRLQAIHETYQANEQASHDHLNEADLAYLKQISQAENLLQLIQDNFQPMDELLETFESEINSLNKWNNRSIPAAQAVLAEWRQAVVDLKVDLDPQKFQQACNDALQAHRKDLEWDRALWKRISNFFSQWIHRLLPLPTESHRPYRSRTETKAEDTLVILNSLFAKSKPVVELEAIGEQETLRNN